MQQWRKDRNARMDRLIRQSRLLRARAAAQCNRSEILRYFMERQLQKYHQRAATYTPSRTS